MNNISKSLKYAIITRDGKVIEDNISIGNVSIVSRIFNIASYIFSELEEANKVVEIQMDENTYVGIFPLKENELMVIISKDRKELLEMGEVIEQKKRS